MRINKFIAQATGISRRAADQAISEGHVTVNGQAATPGMPVSASETVEFDGKRLKLPDQSTIVMLNKPTGYVCSRSGQGSKTIYDLLPPELHRLKPVGRLDKDSSGLLLLTDDGHLANRLTHPRYAKEKRYEVTLNKSLSVADKLQVEQGVRLEDGPSRLTIASDKGQELIIIMQEGRNRQIRRTFAALGYDIIRLHRTDFGPYSLGDLAPGKLYYI